MCSTPDCTRPVRNAVCGLCQACYRRKRRAESPEVAEACRESCRKAYAKKIGRTPEPPRFGKKWRSTATADDMFDRYLQLNYKLTLAQYRELSASQGDVCAICDKPDSSKKRKLHVDHDHKTNKIRGLLCHSCNAALGQFRDSTSILQKAIAYLSVPRIL